MLELMPDILLWIDFRRVGWEILDRHSSDGVHLPKFFEFTAPVDLRSIPQHEHSFWNVRQEVAKEQHGTMRADRRCVNLHVQTALKRQPSNDRQVLVGKGRTQDRRFAGVAPCLGHGWTQKEAGLVNEDDGSGLILGFFLIAGQPRLSQSERIASSRCEARKIGFWYVQLSWWSKRDTWAGWYRTPNSRSITWAIRAQVQTSPTKLKLSAPRSNNVSRWRSCSSERRAA